MALTDHQTLCRRAYTYKSPTTKPEKSTTESSEASSETKPDTASSDGTAEKTSSTSSHHHSVTKQLPLATWLSLSPYGSSRLSPLTLWINLQYLGEHVLHTVHVTDHVSVASFRIIGVVNY